MRAGWRRYPRPPTAAQPLTYDPANHRITPGPLPPARAARPATRGTSRPAAASGGSNEIKNPTRTSGFVVAADEGPPYWFLNTLTITKVGSDQCHGQMSILDHRVPPGFAPPPHIHHHSDEALLILDGQLDGLCGDSRWRAGPGSLVFMPRAIPHGLASSPTPGRGGLSSWPHPVASTSSSRPQAGQHPDLCLPVPVPPDPARLTELAAAHGIQVLPAPGL